jgi:hypothetical protein
MNEYSKRNKTEIFYSRKKLLALLAGSIIFSAIGCWMIIQPQRTFTFHFIPVPTKILGIFCILFFGAVALILFKRISGNKPAITIDELGMEYTSGLSDEYLLWQDVHSVSIMRIKQQKFIMIELTDPEKYYRQKNQIMRFFSKFNQRIWKGHIGLSANGMEISFDDLYKLIRARVFKSTQVQDVLPHS